MMDFLRKIGSFQIQKFVKKSSLFKMPIVTYTFGEYATVEVNDETGDMTCTCPEVDPHNEMNVNMLNWLPCIVTRWVAAHWPPV